MKICVKETHSKSMTKLLNSSMLEDEICELKTSRSCPTGYSMKELKNSDTLELLHLRKTTYEYLNLRSSKTRNAEFIFLVKRINKELERRKINVPVTKVDFSDEKLLSNNYKKVGDPLPNAFDEISNYLQMYQKNDKGGEYCYLARKRGTSNKEIVLDNLAICNSHFKIAKNSQNFIPDFLQDSLPQTDLSTKKSSNDYEVFSSMSSTELSADKERMFPKGINKSINSCGILEFDDMCCFIPSEETNVNREYEADEVLFLTQHN